MAQQTLQFNQAQLQLLDMMSFLKLAIKSVIIKDKK